MTAPKAQPFATILAPAKVNLSLAITVQRDDGYHLLDSVVVFTEFGDQLSLYQDSEDQVVVTGPFAAALSDTSADNICHRALAQYRAAGGRAHAVRIVIDKHIPVGAGLGGGSADAAALLRCLNDHTPAPLAAPKLHEIALSLGADVPACLISSTLRMRGIGEDITPHPQPDERHLLLANPGIALATADVFKAFSLKPRQNLGQNLGQNPNLQPADQKSGRTWVDFNHASNDLESAACDLMPEIGDLMTDLQSLDGVQTVRMSGSGASCFALFSSQTACQRAAQELCQRNIWAVATKII